jgi:alkanesulfonate monooxygenase SsuD/methylene tetrahydromethanopterin reductase-like flavin-dependent oxidoreductase (luciferase family)
VRGVAWSEGEKRKSYATKEVGDMSKPSIGLHFDFRNPPSSGRSYERLYVDVMELIVEAERLGFGSVWTAEHHFTDDGDTPAPLIVLAAVAARTTTIRLGTNLIVLPLHNPLRLAEDAATLAILSGGRFDLGVGAGYIPQDFAAFGQRMSHRPSLMEEGIGILRQALAGGPVQASGRRWDLPNVSVQPLPQDPSSVRLFVGAVSDAAIERAARLGDGFLCGTPDTLETYLKVARATRDTPGAIVMTKWWVISEDPERTWAEIGRHALYQVNKYIAAGSWGDMPLYENSQQLLTAGHYTLHDGPSAVAELRQLFDRVPEVADVHFYGLLPGESVTSGAERIAYVGANVVKALR